MKNWYKKYVNYIVGCLVAMLCLKSCNLNRMERWYNSELSKKEYVIDSLGNNMIKMHDSIYIYTINHDILVQRIAEMEEQLEYLKLSNKHFQRTQSTLINTNKNLSEQK